MHEDPFGIKPLKGKTMTFFHFEFSEQKIIKIAMKIEETMIELKNGIEPNESTINKLEMLTKVYNSMFALDFPHRRKLSYKDRLSEKEIYPNKNKTIYSEIEKGIKGVEF